MRGDTSSTTKKKKEKQRQVEVAERTLLLSRLQKLGRVEFRIRGHPSRNSAQ
jgi:hypothetical protein